jgi:hypothetical protein
MDADTLRQRLIRSIDDTLAGPGAQTFARPPLYRRLRQPVRRHGRAAAGLQRGRGAPGRRAAPTTCTTPRRRCS